MITTAIISLVIFFLALSSLTGFQESNAQQFNRQEVTDFPKDLFLLNTNPETSILLPSGTLTFENQLDLEKCLNDLDDFPTDITAFSYLSDGKMLNVTLWLSSDLKNQQINTEPLTQDNFKTSSWNYLTYTMSIDINSVYETGSDYFFTIHWDPISQTWKSSLEEGSVTGVKRFIEMEDVTASFANEQNFVVFSLDLSKIGQPNQYNIILQTYTGFVDKTGKFCQLLDISNWAQIPPPQFQISTLPSSIIIRPGEEINVEIQIESTTNVKSNVELTTGKIEDLELTFLSEKAFVPPNGIGTAVLKVKALENAETRSYTVPLFSNFTFETVSQLRGGDFAHNSKSANIFDLSNIVVTVNPKISFEEQFGSFMAVYGSIIGLIGGAIGGTSVKFFLDRRHEKKNNEE